MKLNNHKICIVILFILSYSTLLSQESTKSPSGKILGSENQFIHESINMSCGNVSGTGGTVSYSVGQLFYVSNFGQINSVVEGVQQPFEIYEPIGIEYDDIKLNISAYPNPSSNYLTLRIDSLDFEDLSYSIFDLKGNPIENKKIINNLMNIDMSYLFSSVYFLKILNKSKEIKTFKIIRR